MAPIRAAVLPPLDDMPTPFHLHRIAIELVAAEAGALNFVSEETFEAALDLVSQLPKVATIDLGILHDATTHPVFGILLMRAAASLRNRGGTVVVWVAAPGLRELPPLPEGVTLAFGILPGAMAGTVD